MTKQVPSPWWDKLPATVGVADAAALRQVRAAIEEDLPGRLDALVLINPPTRDKQEHTGEWHLIALVRNLDHDREAPRLQRLAATFAGQGMSISLSGVPADRRKIDTHLLGRIDSTGIPVASQEGLTVTEHHLWQRDETDLHELVDGQPQRLPDEKQSTRRFFRALTAAVAAFGSWEAGQAWMERFHPELGSSPWETAAKDWGGVVRVLRLLEGMVPGCTQYDPENSKILIGYAPKDLLREAERLAAIEAER